MLLATFLPGCNKLDIVFNSLDDESAPAAGFEDLDRVTVVHVVDGDTLDVELDSGETKRIRPILVDAPEICH